MSRDNYKDKVFAAEPTSNPHDIFSKRGITPPGKRGGHVARAQGFRRYEGDDWRERRAIVAETEWLYGQPDHPSAFYDDHRGPTRDERPGTPAELRAEEERAKSGTGGPRKGPRSWTSWLVSALPVDGWLMPRHAVMPDHEVFGSAPVAQLRPDRPVQERPYWHSHHRLSQKQYGPEDASARTRHEFKIGDLVDPDDPKSAFIPTGHLHPLTGKPMIPYEGRHRHIKRAKYLYTPGNTALRLGTSPLTRERGYGSPDELFVFVMEGTLKMCAVTEAGYPAIDAGSVTLWESQGLHVEYDGQEFIGGLISELDEFAERHLQGRAVAVVCDSDWYANPLVYDQTQKVVAILAAKGARAVACAPPEGESLGWIHPIKGEMRKKRGVDDWLGEHPRNRRKRALLGLVFRERVGDAELTADDARLDGHGFYRPGREATVKALEALGAGATPGTCLAPYRESQLMKALGGRSKSRVQDDMERARRAGLVSYLTLAEKYYLGGEFRMTAPWVRLVPEAVPPTREVTLGEWWAG